MTIQQETRSLKGVFLYSAGSDRNLSRLTKYPMDEKSKAPVGGVETPAKEVIQSNGAQSASTGQKDPEQLLAEANARISKITEERDNYKRGMLKAKGKLDDEDEDTVDPREVARQAALEVLAESDLAHALSERDTLIAQTLKENKELRLAVTNRPGTGTGQGGNQDAQKPKDNVLSEEQERDLRSRGWDDKKIEHFKSLAGK
jgi:hypothetical protein